MQLWKQTLLSITQWPYIDIKHKFPFLKVQEKRKHKVVELIRKTITMA